MSFKSRSLLLTTLVVLGIVLGHSHKAEAVFMFDFDFLNLGGTFSQTDSIDVRARITNKSTEGETLGGSDSDYNFVGLPNNPLDYYSLNDVNLQFFKLNPGESIDVAIKNLVPSKNREVPLGNYSTQIALTASGPGQQGFPAILLGAINKDYSWSVQEAVVPEPTTIALFGMGLLGGVLRKRRK